MPTDLVERIDTVIRMLYELRADVYATSKIAEIANDKPLGVGQADELLTVKEFRSRYKIGQSKAYQLVHAKGFPVVRTGRNGIRIRAVEVDGWLKRHRELLSG